VLRKQIKQVKNFALYYGAGKEEELSQFDLVIVEPLCHTYQAIRRMTNIKTLVLAYLSVIEIHPTDPDFSLLREEDFIKIGSRPLTNHIYGNFLVNPQSKRWTNIVLHRVGRLLAANSYSGLFLDTIGDVEDYRLTINQRAIFSLAAANLLKEIRRVFPEHVLIQNNGLEMLCDFTALLIDGICWENPPLAQKENEKWVKGIVQKLCKIKQRNGIQIMLLFEQKEEFDSLEEEVFSLGRELARNKGFFIYRAPSGYIKGISPIT
jgi:hypothetical protein